MFSCKNSLAVIGAALLLCGLLGVADAQAGFYNQITIYDSWVYAPDNNTWYNRGADLGEDQEVEPGNHPTRGNVTSQVWDLEGVFHPTEL